jgi:hypothetical protein
MIFAGDLLAVEPSIGKRNAAVRTGVTYSEIAALDRPPQDQWNAQQHSGRQVLAGYLRGSQRGIPVVIKKSGGRPGRCNLSASNFASHDAEFPYYSGRLELYEAWQYQVALQVNADASTALSLPASFLRERYRACVKNRAAPTDSDLFPLYPGLTSLRENLCRPRGTQIYFPLHPALRLRLRAGLSLFRPPGSIFARSVPHANQNSCTHTDSRALGYDCSALRAGLLGGVRYCDPTAFSPISRRPYRPCWVSSNIFSQRCSIRANRLHHSSAQRNSQSPAARICGGHSRHGSPPTRLADSGVSRGSKLFSRGWGEESLLVELSTPRVPIATRLLGFRSNGVRQASAATPPGAMGRFPRRSGCFPRKPAPCMCAPGCAKGIAPPA